MLKKFIQIRNVGKFKKYDTHGDVQFQELTLVFGDNGRGKTTLAAILRSLTENDPNHILERRTTGSDTPIEVSVLSERGRSNFIDEKEWDHLLPDIEIFDSTFVNENIYSGNVVVHEHKKNLYYFVVGSTGVKLAEEIERLDLDSRENNNAIKDKKIDVEEKISWKRPLDTFIALPEIDNIDAEIKKGKIQVKNLEEAEQIQNRGLLNSIKLLEFPKSDFEVLLTRTIDDVARDAESRMKEHISSCMDNHGETWIRDGLTYMPHDDTCPFCGQELEGIELIRSYQDYFSKSYTELKTDLREMRGNIDDHFSQANLLAIQRAFDENVVFIDAWQECVQIESSDLEFKNFIDSWNNAHNTLIFLIEKKENQPLDKIFQEKEIRDALNQVETLEKSASSYDSWASRENQRIREFKRSIQTGDINIAKDQLDKLEATKERYSESVADLCNDYLSLIAKREQLQNEKEAARQELKDFADKFFEDCLSTINQYLEKFGTGFRLDKMKPSFAGGKPSATYGLSLDDISVGLGSASTIGEPSFKSVLSDGDKNTLAFAFFLTKLEHDQDIAHKIVVFDDPITSFGVSRKFSTQQEILKVFNKAKQVIVLSYDPHFLRMIWNNAHKTKTLHIPRKGKGSSIEEWDIASDTQGDYYKSYFDLVSYLEKGEGDPRTIVKCIRPVLEGNLRVRFPRDFPPNEWLGDFIKKLENAKESEPLFSIKKDFDEVCDINDYSKKYHHQQNPNADAEPVNETELAAYVGRTLKVLSS